MKKITLYWKRQEADNTPVQTMTHTDYTDDIGFLANIATQAMLHSLERQQVLYASMSFMDKTENMCFNQNQTRDITTLTGGSLKPVDKFMYLRSNDSSTENDAYTCLVKAWSNVDRVSVVWKSDLSNKIKHNFSKPRSCLIYYMDSPYGSYLSIEKNLDDKRARILRAILYKSWK